MVNITFCQSSNAIVIALVIDMTIRLSIAILKVSFGVMRMKEKCPYT